MPEVSVRRALGWKKPLHTDVVWGRDSSKKPDECVIRLAPYLQMFPFEVEVDGWRWWRGGILDVFASDTSQQKLGADHLLSNEMGGR